MKIITPLDWMGVTDAPGYVGIIQDANTPGSVLSKTELGKKRIVKDKTDIQRIDLMLGQTMIDNKPIPGLVAAAIASSRSAPAVAPPCRQAGHLDLPRRRLGQGIRT